MPSTQELRRRIRSVASTRQITRAMEMVSTAKMRKATERALMGRPYADTVKRVLAAVLNNPENQHGHPLLDTRTVQKQIIVLIASDRGLAGFFNTAVARQAHEIFSQDEAKGIESEFITIGKKASQYCARFDMPLIQAYPNFTTHPSTHDILPIVKAITDAYAAQECDRVILVYTKFGSMLKQDPSSLTLLPAEIPEDEMDDFGEESKATILFEPSAEAVLDNLIPRLIEASIYQAVMESLASEHSARRVAMKSATDNAGNLIDDLNLTYNSLRQDAITREIAEITGGAAALVK